MFNCRNKPHHTWARGPGAEISPGSQVLGPSNGDGAWGGVLGISTTSTHALTVRQTLVIPERRDVYGGRSFRLLGLLDFRPSERQTNEIKIAELKLRIHLVRSLKTFVIFSGGAQNLSCLYRIESDKVRENIHLSLHNISFGKTLQNNCMTEVDPNTSKLLIMISCTIIEVQDIYRYVCMKKGTQ
jgi:hypothetical protein